jgi:hypothetical protein
VQRTLLRTDREIHPLLERIMRIHVTEEARHLSFARGYLRANVPELPARKRRVIATAAPIILAQEASVMLRPPRHLVRAYQIPRPVLRHAGGPASPSRQQMRDALRKVRNLLTELDLVTPSAKRLWRRLGIWDEPQPHHANRTA